MDYSRPDLADRLAAAYVTGILRGAARRRFEALLPAHASLRSATQAWQERLMPLTLAIPPQAPPPRVWQRIEARIDGRGAAATPKAHASAKARGTGGWSLGFWRGLAGVASLAALSFGLLLLMPAPSRAPVIVVLSATASVGGTAPASFVASISGDRRSLVTRPLVKVGLASDRALELWAVPPSGAPRSLGLISSDGVTVLRKGSALQGAASLAVSLEPAGGSPTGAPTGPVLYAGKLTL